MIAFNGKDYKLDYINMSINYMTQRFHDRCLLFIVCSDDNKWATTTVQTVMSNLSIPAGGCRPKVVYYAGSSGSEDMAVLASCNHTIITVGSYGWWSAYLAGGVTVYYSKYPPMQRVPLGIRENDVYLPAWIGLP
jgi:galactoside 2-L-fucosyltransferase 1/2